MGQILVKIYEEIAKEGSIKAKMELAIKTKLPSTKAALEVDSPENIQKFKNAYKEITGKDCLIK